MGTGNIISAVPTIGELTRGVLWPPFETGALRLPIEAKFPLEKTEQAFELMKSNAHFGKIVVTQER
jgi:NADPH:quinone reductase-like Zn-dependent oxidoreductase